jgi:hypothetical protein
MANDDDESKACDDGINWWELDEAVWLELQRNAGAFRTFEDECIALVTFRHMVKLRERGVFEKPSPPRPARAPRKPSLAAALRKAKKAGVDVTSATVTGQGVVLTIGERAADTNQQSDEVEAWIQKHAH